MNKMKSRMDKACAQGTISSSERLLSIIAGGFILGYSVKKTFKKPLVAASGLALGTALFARGITGKCPVKGRIDPEEEAKGNLTLIERQYFEK